VEATLRQIARWKETAANQVALEREAASCV
jgi:hypothetical protein